MHSATLDTAAAILLLSSIGSMGLLVKRTPKSRFTSPTSIILIISDILSSILTALMVLFHHFYVNSRRLWDSEVKKVINFDSKYAYDLPRKSRNNFGLNSTEFPEGDTNYEDCDLKSVFFQYATFFIPFINAFLSLLNFSFNCYTDAKDIDKRCCKFICAQSDAEKNIAVEAEVESHPTKEKDVETKLPSMRQRLAGSKIYRQKYKGLALLSQWLLPALFTGTFHRAAELKPRPSEDLLCVVAANFPFENCAEDLELEESISGIPSTVPNYVSSEDNLFWPNPNSSEVDVVLKRLFDVVQAALNDSARPSESDGYFNMTQLLDIANDTATNYDGLQVRSNSIQRRVNEYYASDESSGASGDYLKPHLLSLNENEKIVANNLQLAECMKHRCLVPVRFLKIYLFVLLVLIYFAPILISSLLLVVSYYKCREAAKKIKVAKAFEDKAVQNAEEAAGDEESNKEGWFAAKTEETVAAEQVEDSVPSKSHSKVEESMCALAFETDKMQGFFRVFKMNAVLAVVLWTPFFFQIIFKVFFCSRVPKWVTEVSFLATMIFAVFRNAVNLNIVKMEADAENYKKHNSVHPNR